MYNKEQSISISCDNCGDVYIDEHTGFSLYPDEIGAHEAVDNDEWHSSEGEHYCPLCHTINDNDELIIDSGRTILHGPSVPVKEDDWYPGKDYQRLFDVVNETVPTPQGDKTASEILMKRFPYAPSLDWYKPIIECMEEYASHVKGQAGESVDFQKRVDNWVQDCFGAEIAADIKERNHRFFEEATELVQSTGITKSECMQLVDYVFNRPVGETKQEVGGVVVTLHALCNALKISVGECGETELTRINGKIEQIRAK